MSWWSDFTKTPINQAQDAANAFLERIEPAVLRVEHRAMGMLHGLLTRLNGTTLTLNIPPQPSPDETSEIRKAEKT